MKGDLLAMKNSNWLLTQQNLWIVAVCVLSNLRERENDCVYLKMGAPVSKITSLRHSTPSPNETKIVSAGNQTHDFLSPTAISRIDASFFTEVWNQFSTEVLGSKLCRSVFPKYSLRLPPEPSDDCETNETVRVSQKADYVQMDCMKTPGGPR